LDNNKIAEYIKDFLPFDCRISFKESKSHIILIKKKFFTTVINLNPVFLKADKNLIHDIINFIGQNNKESLASAKKNITDFYHENYKPKKPRIKKFYMQKNIYSLFFELTEPLKNRYSDADFSLLNICWGKNYRNQKRSIRFGSFDRRHNLIRIHPRLDNQGIPDFFIKSVMLHEIAHFIAFSIYKNIKPHSRKFHEIVKSIDPYLKAAKVWEKDNKHIFFKN
jgi:hypothetical protein